MLCFGGQLFFFSSIVFLFADSTPVSAKSTKYNVKKNYPKKDLHLLPLIYMVYLIYGLQFDQVYDLLQG